MEELRNIPEYDVIILGTGPAGLQAAIHAARKRAKVLVLGRAESSSLYKAHIENYCCVSGVKTGEELINVGIEQAKGFGATFIEEDVVKTEAKGDFFSVTTESGELYDAYALIMATGISRKGLGVPKEKELVGKGISYCVDCDANFYRNAKVAVTGNGSGAAHGAVTLGKIADQVTLITNELKVSPALKEELNKDNITIIQGGKVTGLEGDDKLEAVILADGTRLEVDGLFIEKGAKGAMELAAFLGVALDPEKFTFIVTDKNQATNVPGIYAAGDICGPPFQMAKAVGEGCIAGLSAATYALRQRREGKKKENDS